SQFELLHCERIDPRGHLSPWTTVHDPYTAPAATIDIFNIDRNVNTGYRTYDIAGSSAAYWSSNGVCARAGFGCTLGIQGRLSSDGSAETIDSTAISYPDPSINHEFSSSIDTPKIDAVRTYVSGYGGNVYSDWTAVRDPYTAPAVAVTVKSIQVNPTTGAFEFDANASSAAYWSQEGVCRLPGWGCTIGLEVKRADGSTAQIGSSSIAYPNPSTTQEFTDSDNLTGVTDIRSFISGHNGTLYSSWIPVSNNVQDGMDVRAAIGLIVEGAAASGVPCLTLFQVGTHEAGSSESDEELACEGALGSGKNLTSFLTGLVSTRGLKFLAALAVTAGLAKAAANRSSLGITLDASGNEVLPTNCSYTAPLTITCFSNGTSTQTRDPAAPIQQDPVTENNQTQKFLQNTPKGDLPDPSTLTGPLAGSSPDDEAKVYVDECDQYVNTPIQSSDGSATTVGAAAGVSEDDCPDMPIFFTGFNSPQATAHDAAAI